MLIVGLHNAEDSGLCLIKDGDLLEAVNEERFSRIKQQGGFPTLSLRYILDKYALNIDDIDYFAYGWHNKSDNFADYVVSLTKRTAIALRDNPNCIDILVQRVSQEFNRDKKVRELFEDEMLTLGVKSEKIKFFDHHACHAWAAFSCSPFDNAYIFTFDGRGDFKSSSVWLADKEHGLQEKHSLLSFDSLGFLYGQITYFLGYKPHRHEGKILGLAAHGNPDISLPLFQSLIRFDDGELIAQIGPYKPFYTNIDPSLQEKYKQYSPEDLAAGLQKHCENLVVDYVKYWSKPSSSFASKNICLAGGVAANVRINQCISEIETVENLFVFPHMGDGGLPLGSAAHLLADLTSQTKLSFNTVSLGPAFSDDEIQRALNQSNDLLAYEVPQDKIKATVDDLVLDKVVGWFDARMEYGPRALGCRSIMYHTKDKSVNQWLNKRMDRTEFMPFAPVTPDKYAQSAYIGWKSHDSCTPYMTRTFVCTDKFVDMHPAVVHIDRTARPQVTTKFRNGDYHLVVESYCDRTGEMALINTSFNRHEEPIVCSPQDAIGSLVSGMIDVLIIGKFRVVKL